MLDTSSDAVTRRLERLERANETLARECRRWRRIGAGAFAASCLVILAGAGVAARTWPTIEAGEFVLRDKQGTARAALALRPDGTPGLGLFNKKGQVRLSFDLATDDAPRVNLYGDDGGLRAALALRPDGTPGLGFFDKDLMARLSLDMASDDSAGVNLFGKGGALRTALAVRPDGTPALGLFDQKGRVRQTFEIEPEIEAPAQLTH